MNSRAKGTREERLAANWWTAQGFPMRRGRQYAGHPDAPDIIPTEPHALDGFHVEVKGTQRLRPLPYIDKAIQDAGGERIPFVHWHPPRREPLILMRASDLAQILRDKSPR